jgi:hypothetical protein
MLFGLKPLEAIIAISPAPVWRRSPPEPPGSYCRAPNGERGFSATRCAIARQPAGRFGCGWAEEGFSLTPKAGSDIGGSGHPVFSNGVMGIGRYACSDRRAALLDAKVRARAQWSDAAPRCLIAGSVALHSALEVYPEPSDAANQPRIHDAGNRLQPLQQLLVADEMGSDHAEPAKAPSAVYRDTGIRDPAIGAILRYCWIKVFIQSLISFCEYETGWPPPIAFVISPIWLRSR